MEPIRRLPVEIDEVLRRGGTVLTGNRRAARILRLDFDRQRRAEGLRTWQPPAIVAWETWQASLWHQAILDGHTDRLLLNRSQELQLWRSIIASDSEWSGLQSMDSLATMSADAWQQLCAFRGQQRLNSLGVSGDTRAFQRWAQAFTRRCKSDSYISASELESAVAASRLKPSTQQVLLVGFDKLTPAREALLDAFRKSGVSVAFQAAEPIAPQLYIAAAGDLDEELTQAALWLRKSLEVTPEQRIAVIHPDIDSERFQIDGVFREILAPEINDITADRSGSPFEFSLGTSLSRQPMVVIAFQLLRWTVAALDLNDISHVILSPYFASRTPERDQRAQFDSSELRRMRLLRPELDLNAFLKHAERARRAAPSSLLNQILGLQRSAARLLANDKQASFSDWADSMRELLRAAAWASAGPDSSVEFQTRRKWESALDELATLDFEGTRTSFAQALDQLERITQRTLFAPESNDTPIQIMSPREAAGSRFDVLYFLRASDLTWPVRPGMIPLLGWRVQRDLKMPGSDAAQDAEDVRRIAARLAASANVVVFSYARETADALQRPSPALTALAVAPLATPKPLEMRTAIDLETIEDTAFIPLKNLRVPGGSSVLRLQAACGFRAFAEMRLWSIPPEVRGHGMDARERGNIVHDALEDLWTGLRTQANLRSLTSEERGAALAHAVDKSLNKYRPDTGSKWDDVYLEVQRERLHSLLSNWLDFELTRPAFEVKLREQEYEDAAIGPLLLSLRVDRIDRVFSEAGEDLGEVILDYKTGIAGPSNWQTERPEAPQLPLYAALREPGSVAGIAFASLRPGEDMGLRGLAAGEGVLHKPARLAFATLEEQIAEWRTILTNLAIDFAEGDARVRPKAYPGTCEFCEQRILCRVDPATLDDLDEEAVEADA